MDGRAESNRERGRAELREGVGDREGHPVDDAVAARVCTGVFLRGVSAFSGVSVVLLVLPPLLQFILVLFGSFDGGDPRNEEVGEHVAVLCEGLVGPPAGFFEGGPYPVRFRTSREKVSGSRLDFRIALMSLLFRTKENNAKAQK